MADFGRRLLPQVHASTHEDGGDDEITVEALSGDLADDQPVQSHPFAGNKHASVTLAAVNADITNATLDDASAARTPSAHESSHESGGTDPLDIASLAGTRDHGGLSGRDDDDHSNYHNNARGDARYPQKYNLYNNLFYSFSYKTIITGTWITTAKVGQYLAFISYNNSWAQNDEIEFEIFAEAGVKTFELLALTSAGAAIITVYLDDVSIGTIDQYSGSDILNVISTLECTVVDTKTHSLKIKATSKNGSSSGYTAYLCRGRIY